MEQNHKDLAILFASNLKHLRKNAGMTQSQLGEKTGYTEKAISKWECGISTPPVNALFLLAGVFNTTIEGLFSHVQSPRYYLGIDGGGTKTDFVFADEKGKILQKLKLGPSNPIDSGFEYATSILNQGICTLTAGIPKNLISVFAGIAGGITGDMQTRIAEFLSQYHFFHAENGSDAENIIAAGLGKNDGIVLIMGTGCSLFVQKDGNRHKIGGFGYLFDHGGSAYDIGNLAIRAACRAEDGSGDSTIIKDLLLKNLNTKTVAENLTYFYSIGKKGIASYAPLVFSAYRAGDKTAENILEQNMCTAAESVTAGGKYFDGREIIRVVIVGGLTSESEILLPMLQKHIRSFDQSRKYDLQIFRGDAVEGALLLAMEKAPAEIYNAENRNTE